MSRACVNGWFGRPTLLKQSRMRDYSWMSRACVNGWSSRPTLLEHLTCSLLVEQYRRDGEAFLV